MAGKEGRTHRLLHSKVLDHLAQHLDHVLPTVVVVVVEEQLVDGRPLAQALGAARVYVCMRACRMRGNTSEMAHPSIMQGKSSMGG